MNIEDEQWIEHALIDYERKRCISKILSINCQDAIPKGNNYGSDMLRFNMKVVLHSGEVVDRSLIYKALPKTEVRRKHILECNAPKKEAKILIEVWPQIEKERQEKECGIERISPACYGVRRGYEGLLMEDLTVVGYKMADRMKLLDFNHAEVVVKAHAQLHAISLVLIERGDLSPSDFSDNVMKDNSKMFEGIVLTAISNLATNIEEKWESEWHCYAEKLREFSKIAMAKFVECFKLDESNVNALTHGDCWLTNMMFKYDSDGAPKNIRLLDFQMSSYNNVGLDLQYFLNSSLNAEVQTRKPELVRLYYDKFKHSLILHGYSGEIPTFENIVESYSKATYFGLIMGISLVPFILQPQEAVPENLEEWMKEIVDENVTTWPNNDTEQFRRVMKVLLKHASTTGIL